MKTTTLCFAIFALIGSATNDLRASERLDTLLSEKNLAAIARKANRSVSGPSIRLPDRTLITQAMIKTAIRPYTTNPDPDLAQAIACLSDDRIWVRWGGQLSLRAITEKKIVFLYSLGPGTPRNIEGIKQWRDAVREWQTESRKRKTDR